MVATGHATEQIGPEVATFDSWVKHGRLLKPLPDPYTKPLDDQQTNTLVKSLYVALEVCDV
jgi:hypothetical protein